MRQFLHICVKNARTQNDATEGVSERIEDGYTQHKVTGTVETPWFGASVGMNSAWRFLLNPQGKIFFVAVDLLASPKTTKSDSWVEG
jgi:hypothetical protein